MHNDTMLPLYQHTLSHHREVIGELYSAPTGRMNNKLIDPHTALWLLEWAVAYRPDLAPTANKAVWAARTAAAWPEPIRRHPGARRDRRSARAMAASVIVAFKAWTLTH